MDWFLVISFALDIVQIVGTVIVAVFVIREIRKL
jgi:hypothetical protein